jgi:hypothetical protein
MRRTAVNLACILFALGCTERWVLPGVGADGGEGTGGKTAASGGRSGGQNSGGAGGRGGTGGRTMCTDVDYLDFEPPKRADLLFIVGRNYSMSQPFGDVTRMSAVQQAVRNVVMANQSAVNFAYEEFPSPNCVNACCASTEIVYPQLGNYASIDRATRRCEGPGLPADGCVSISNSRPVADALHNVLGPTMSGTGILDPLRRNDRYVVLLIDGPPACAPSESSVTSCNGALNQASVLNNADVDLIVVPIGQETETATCLQSLAINFEYLARDPAMLMNSLSQIVKTAATASCVIRLREKPPAGRLLQVSIHDVGLVPMNGQDGWDFAAGSDDLTIELHGSSCETFQRMGLKIDIRSVCP